MAADHAQHTAEPPRRDLVVIGASAGGLQVLLELARGLPADFPAAILVVMHVGAHPSVLPELMRANGVLPAVHPVDGQPLHAGQIFIAPPDHHLLVEDDHVRIVRGPKENFARPAIDPLFRTAALAYGPRVIGVVLSGRLDDGTAGLQAIKRCGGLAVVQDPVDAEQPDMPTSALTHVQVDYRLPAAGLAPTLLRLVREPASGDGSAVPPDIQLDQAISAGVGNPMEKLNAIGARSRFTCPECSGVLWEIDDAKPRRFRCHTGHAFTLRTLASTQDLSTDEALWSAMRALQEREALQRALAEAGDADGEGLQGEALLERAAHTGQLADEMRSMIQSG